MMSELIPNIPFPDLAPGPHLLLDHHVVADSFRLKRTLHQPQLDGDSELDLPDAGAPRADWEGVGHCMLRVVRDEERGVFRMWYHVQNFINERIQWETRRKQLGEPQRLYICYAESEDGVNWTRPDLQIYDDNQGRNNICFKGFSQAGGATIMLPDESPEGKYLLFNLDWFSDKDGGFSVAQSDDGIHWEYRENQPVVFGHFDTTNSVLYNRERAVWMWYTRAFASAAYRWMPPERNTRRRVAYSQSADLDKWSEPQIVLAPDELDTNDFYSLQVFRQADYYLGFLQVYDEEDAETLHIELAWSRDGMNWSRLPARPQLIPAGETTGLMIVPTQMPIEIDGEWFLYFTAFGIPHNAPRETRLPRGRSLRGKMRRDGFVSLRAGRPPGMLLSRPFTRQGDSISINARIQNSGELRAELVEPFNERNQGDYGGKLIAGFGADDFDVFEGDSTSHLLSWRGNADLSALRGRRLMLRIALSCGEIWSFTI